MIKKLLLLLLCSASFLTVAGQHDPQALKLIDRMTLIIGDLESFSYTMTNCRDIRNPDYETRTFCNSHEVFIDGPTRMLAKSSGDNGPRELFYNGELFHYYNVSENNYVALDAPPTMMETLDTLHELYDFDFPAADFFYPSLTEDLIGFCDKISYVGTAVVHGNNCHVIIASNDKMVIQIWIRNDAASLPQKMVINYKNDKQLSRYETIFTDWNLSNKLPVSMFDFVPAPTARKIAIMAKSK
jgi:hypothetical protein